MSKNILLVAFLGFIATIILNCIISRKFEKIAFDKGYTEEIHAFAMCFCLFLIGYLYVIALPDLKLQKGIAKLQPTKTDQE